MTLEIQHITHYYGENKVLDDIYLEIVDGEVVCLLGPSGCGKTTLLRILAGLERLQAGRIAISGRVLAGRGIDMPPEKRGIGFLFQDFALFPHLSVVENAMFGLSHIREKERRVHLAADALARVGLEDFLQSYPHELSGGQQQRAALARALAPGPGIMLLDEPFSSLDTRLRSRVRDRTLHVLKQSGVATVMVTHDPEEAMFMGDRIVLMNEGRIIQQGDPADLYFRPANAFAATFFSDVNEVMGKVENGAIHTPLGRIPRHGFEAGTDVVVMFRPEAVRLIRDATAQDRNDPAAPDSPDPGFKEGSKNKNKMEARLSRDIPSGNNESDEGVHGIVEATRLLLGATLVHLRVGANGDGGAGVHVHARVPGLIRRPEAGIVRVVLDRSQVFVFPAEQACAAGSDEALML